MILRDAHGFDGGAYLAQSGVGKIPDTLLAGRNCIPRGPGLLRSLPGSLDTGIQALQRMCLVGRVRGGVDSPSGNMISFRRRSIWWIADRECEAIYDDFIMPDGASPSLRGYIVPNPPDDPDSSFAFLAGIEAPHQPAVAGADDTDGKLDGAYSLKLTLVRPVSGGESSASVVSETFTVTTGHVVITLDPDWVFDGITRFAVYGTKRGFSAGPWYFIGEFPFIVGDVFTPFLELDWSDGDLADVLAPLDFDPPPEGNGVFSMGQSMCVVGVDGRGSDEPGGFEAGPMCAVSYPGKPEAYPPDLYFSLNPSEAPLGAIGRSTDAFTYIPCRNSLHAGLQTQTTAAPIIFRSVWSDTGFPSMSALCLVESELWGYIGKLGPVRTQGGTEPDASFGLHVSDYMRASWSPETVVVTYSPDEQVVLYAHGNEGFAYDRRLGVWSNLIILSDDPDAVIHSALSIEGRAELAIEATSEGAGGTLTRIWRLFEGEEPIDGWEGIGCFRDAGAPLNNKTILWVNVSGSGEQQVTLYANMDLETPAADLGTVGQDGRFHSRVLGANLCGVKSYAIGLAGVLAGQEVHMVAYQGEITEELT